MNGSWVQWAVGVMFPIVLAMGIWVGGIDNRVDVNAAQAQKIEKIEEDVKEIDKKVTAILCKVAPERCL